MNEFHPQAKEVATKHSAVEAFTIVTPPSLGCRPHNTFDHLESSESQCVAFPMRCQVMPDLGPP